MVTEGDVKAAGLSAAREGLPEEVAFALRPERWGAASLGRLWRMTTSVPSRIGPKAVLEGQRKAPVSGGRWGKGEELAGRLES